jgi:Protein of unknown function (DUF3112)
MARIATTVLRIISVRFSTDLPLAIGAQVFVSAGVVILYIVNLIFAQRLMRAAHPNFGWHKLFSIAFKVIYALIIITIIMVIVVGVQSFYTLSPNTHRIDHDIQLYGITFFAVVAFFPLPLVLLGLVFPRRHKLDKFGQGRWRTKVRILLLSSFLISFGAAYRAGTTWLTPVPRTQPLPAYFHKAAFYIVNFGVEIIVVWMYAILRVDRRFHIPDGAHGPGSYSSNADLKHKPVGGDSSITVDQRPQSLSPEDPVTDVESVHDEKKSETQFILPNVYSEEETFDTDEYLESSRADKNREDLETGESWIIQKGEAVQQDKTAETGEVPQSSEATSGTH